MLFLVSVFLCGGFSVGYCTQPVFTTTRSFDEAIQPGQSFQQLVDQWERSGRIRQGFPLLMLAKFFNADRTIQAGVYRFSPKETAQEIIRKLTQGDVIQGRLTIIEGWTVKQMLDSILRAEYLANQDIRHRLAELTNSPEGWFFPDTYKYRAGDTASSVLLRAHERMKVLLATLWANRDPDVPYQNAYEALIAASIIEKETADQRERPIIAGIIVKRLQAGMRLQMDPTVLYGLNGNFSQPLTHRDIQIPNPYNTYRQTGLPPTPICLPSRSSLEAALHPRSTEFWYFVAKGDGTHTFSRTLEQQTQAIRDYRQTINGKV